jgi:hypothetical protein
MLDWQTQPPTKPVRNALLRWCAGRHSYKYALVFSDFNEDSVVMFYDEEGNELTFTIGDDAWLELLNEPT